MANKIAATAALEDDKAGSKQANKQTKVLSFAGWFAARNIILCK